MSREFGFNPPQNQAIKLRISSQLLSVTKSIMGADTILLLAGLTSIDISQKWKVTEE